MLEDIPDADDVSRHLFDPSMRAPDGDLIWVNIFMFKTERNYTESVVWRKYAPSIEEVHQHGCNKQAADRQSGKKSVYFGALTGSVEEVRKIRSAKGARFQVLHVPSEGIHHAEISYMHEQDRVLSKNDRAELKAEIKKKFVARSDHTCPD